MTPARQKQELLIQAAISLMIVLYVSYIDEGYNDFRWMKNPGDWIFFFLYSGFLFGIQLLASRLVLTNYHGRGRVLISLLIGLGGLMGLIFLIGFVISLF